MYAPTSIPFVSRTRATLRSAEFGFLGVVVYTRVHTPRFCGHDRSAGAPVLLLTRRRPKRTSWLRVGTDSLQTPVEHGLARHGRPRHPRRNNMRRNRAEGENYSSGRVLSSGFSPFRCLRLLERQCGLLLRFQLQPAIIRHAGPGRNQVADDDVLLEAPQVVHLALDRGLGQHARRLLEGGRRDEAVGRERGLGDAEQERLERGRLLALLDHALVLLEHQQAVHVLALEERGVARILDAHLLQHLTDDDLDVLVVDADALEAVDLLDLVHQVLLHLLDALDPQDVVRVDRALGEAVACAHRTPLLHVAQLALRDLVLAHVAVVALDEQLAHAARDAPELDAPVDLGDDRELLGPPRLE